MIRILSLGDVVGRPGRRVLSDLLPRLREEWEPSIITVNGENTAGGFGMTHKIYQELVDDLKIDCVTMGNHWHDKKDIHEYRHHAKQLVLPANMANVDDESAGLKILQTASGVPFAVINLIGRVFMREGNRSPFDAVSRLLAKIPPDVKIRIVDLHAEATSEKQGMGHFLAGKVSLVFGTHSHVPTADERVLEQHTGFQTDLGCTGAYDSIIGMNKESALKRLLSSSRHERLEPAKKDLWLCGIVADVDELSGQCQQVQRVQYRVNQMDLS